MQLYHCERKARPGSNIFQLNKLNCFLLLIKTSRVTWWQLEGDFLFASFSCCSTKSHRYGDNNSKIAWILHCLRWLWPLTTSLHCDDRGLGRKVIEEEFLLSVFPLPSTRLLINWCEVTLSPSISSCINSLAIKLQLAVYLVAKTLLDEATIKVGRMQKQTTEQPMIKPTKVNLCQHYGGSAAVELGRLFCSIENSSTPIGTKTGPRKYLTLICLTIFA